MSFVIKNQDINLVVSIVPVKDNEHCILATNFKRYFIEKNVTNEILDDRMTELNAVRFPIKKVIKILTELIPSKSSIEFEADKLKIEVDLTIVVNEVSKKTENLKLFFNLTELFTIEEVSEHFVSGLMKSIIEYSNPILKLSLPEPAIQFKRDIIEMHSKDLSNMLGAKTEKDASQSQKTKDLGYNIKQKLKRNEKRQVIIKPQFVEKKVFEFKESESQEIFLTEEEDMPSTSRASETQSAKDPKKRKKFNVKF